KLVARDDEEEQGPEAREQQRRRHGEAGEDRHQEGGTEHRDHMLRADRDGAGPAQTLGWGDDGAGRDATAVAVKGPEGHACSLRGWIASRLRAVRTLPGSRL